MVCEGRGEGRGRVWCVRGGEGRGGVWCVREEGRGGEVCGV